MTHMSKMAFPGEYPWAMEGAVLIEGFPVPRACWTLLDIPKPNREGYLFIQCLYEVKRGHTYRKHN